MFPDGRRGTSAEAEIVLQTVAQHTMYRSLASVLLLILSSAGLRLTYSAKT